MKKELSIFIDESGDFGKYDPKSPFYIISVVMHEQTNSISSQIATLNETLRNTKLSRDFIHVGPLIRKEAEYQNLDVSDRLKILRRLIKFSTEVNYSYETFMIEKKHLGNEVEMTKKLASQLSNFIRQHYPYFLSFDRIKIYYDNGQVGVTKIIITVFTALFNNVEFKKAMQKDYKMLQVADLVCTATLTELKMKNKALSRSERKVLGTDRDINKELLKPLKKKHFNN